MKSEYSLFGLTTCLTEALGILFHNVIKFLGEPGQLSLEATIIPGTAKVLSSNLTYFFNLNSFFTTEMVLI